MGGQSKAVCILGMHRSGTSMITRCLNLLGVDLGNDSDLIIKGEKFNQEGYWEHKEIMLRQQQILKKFSRSWDTQVPLPGEWWKRKDIALHKKRLKQIIINEFIDKRLWGWKDPRTSLLLPMWQEFFQELNISPTYVIVVRNPLDVAHSLNERNGFSKIKSFQIWGLYTLSSLHSSIGSNRTLIHYDSFIDNWENKIKKAAEKIDIILPCSKEIKKTVDSFIQPELQHSKSTIEDLLKEKDVPKDIASLYKLILKTDESPELIDSEYFEKFIREMYEELYE
ncbi:sulfotransferase family protein [Scopulibacillus cellulosilyticus]|uniref:Sulfotransferase family protein n=1 Tax=Scopulibacillus cellulosilyticus TaxID=2665665 RepID=A0ABW2PYD8_9BACL